MPLQLEQEQKNLPKLRLHLQEEMLMLYVKKLVRYSLQHLLVNRKSKHWQSKIYTVKTLMHLKLHE